MKEFIAETVATMLVALAEMIRQGKGVEIVLERVDLADAPKGKDVWRIQITTPRSA